MPSPYHHGDLRRALLAEARRAVEADGPDGVSMRALAAAVGVSPSAAYHHFAGKDELLAAVGGQALDDMGDVLGGASGTTGDAVADLVEVGTRYVMVALGAPGVFRLMFSPALRGDSPTGRQVDARGEALMDVVRAAVARVHDDGALRGDDVDEAVLAVWSLSHGLAMLLLDGPLDPAARAEDEVRARLDRAVRGVVVTRGGAVPGRGPAGR